MRTTLTAEQAAYLNHAQENLQQWGELEFDDDAVVAVSTDGGAYVQCWRWIDRADVKELNQGEEP